MLHNWWGNGVYVDWQRGNWSEGLTTFMADYAYKEDESEAAAREMRLDLAARFRRACPSSAIEPLRAFTSRTHDASQIVGYDKAAFLFLMLRDEISRDAFDAALRQFFITQQFHRASWADLEHAFARQSGRDLQGILFAMARPQWRARPESRAGELRSNPVRDIACRPTLAQGEPPYRLRVPIAVETERGTRRAASCISIPRGRR